jgi:hypothetical protein
MLGALLELDGVVPAPAARLSTAVGAAMAGPPSAAVVAAVSGLSPVVTAVVVEVGARAEGSTVLETNIFSYQ